MIDSHSHIYAQEFDDDRAAVVERARQAGVTHIVLPNENLDSLARQRRLFDTDPAYFSMTVGLHPEEVGCDNYATQLDSMHKLLFSQSQQFVAVGEIGMDLYWDTTWRDRQVEVLDTQLRWCADLHLPFIMHCRSGIDEVLSVFANFGATVPQGVFHSFTGTATDVERLRHYGDFYFGVNGIVTFKKSDVPVLLPIFGLNRILLETDSPYLAPVPRRGQRNESANIPLINACVASHLGITAQEVSAATDANARRLFKF